MRRRRWLYHLSNCPDDFGGFGLFRFIGSIFTGKLSDGEMGEGAWALMRTEDRRLCLLPSSEFRPAESGALFSICPSTLVSDLAIATCSRLSRAFSFFNGWLCISQGHLAINLVTSSPPLYWSLYCAGGDKPYPHIQSHSLIYLNQHLSHWSSPLLPSSFLLTLPRLH